MDLETAIGVLARVEHSPWNAEEIDAALHTWDATTLLDFIAITGIIQMRIVANAGSLLYYKQEG